MPQAQPEIAMHPYQLGLVRADALNDRGHFPRDRAGGPGLQQLRFGKRSAHQALLHAKKLGGCHHSRFDMNPIHPFRGKSHGRIHAILKRQIRRRPEPLRSGTIP